MKAKDILGAPVGHKTIAVVTPSKRSFCIFRKDAIREGGRLLDNLVWIGHEESTWGREFDDYIVLPDAHQIANADRLIDRLEKLKQRKTKL